MSQPTANNWISDYDITIALQKLERAIQRRIQKHGNKPHASAHETLGIIQEELYEVMKCIHENQDPIITAKELRDVAVAAIWGMIGLENGDD